MGSQLNPRLIACSEGHESMVRWLLDQGADIMARNVIGRDALYHASRHGCLGLVSLLIERGGNVRQSVDVAGWNILMSASYLHHSELVECLLKRAAAIDMIDARTNDGQTALYWSCCGCNPGVVKLLLDAGADPRIADRHGLAPLDVAKHPLHSEETVNLLQVCS